MSKQLRYLNEASDLTRLFEDFNKLKVMVIGDVMIDAYVFGTVDRISPEAPVPVVAVKERVNRLGGAANVALNIHALGATPVLVSVIGDDVKGSEFLDLLRNVSLDTVGILSSSQRITTTKFRVIGNKVQMLRVDEEITSDINESESQALLEKIESILAFEKIDVIILQDYNKGILTEHVILQIIQVAKNHHIPVAVDPKKKHFQAYSGVSFFKPNLKELKDGLGLVFDSSSLLSIKDAVQMLQEQLKVDIVMATLSEKGVLISEQSEADSKIQFTHIPAHLRAIADVSGAGDTVISVASLCLALNLDMEWLAEMANLAGGLVCEQLGVVPVDKNKLLAEAFKVVASKKV